MGIAKSCDRCEALYKTDTEDMPYQIKRKSQDDDLDLCPECAFLLEEFMTNLEKFKSGSKGKKHKWGEEARQRAAERQTIRTDRAKQISEKNPKLSWGECLSKAGRELKEEKEADQEPDEEEEEKPNPKDTVQAKKKQAIEELAVKIQKKNKISWSEAIELARDSYEEDTQEAKILSYTHKKKERHAFDADVLED